MVRGGQDPQNERSRLKREEISPAASADLILQFETGGEERSPRKDSVSSVGAYMGARPEQKTETDSNNENARKSN